MRNFLLFIGYIALLAGCTPSFEGYVTKVNDGDSIIVRSKGHSVAVRLADIDAPDVSTDQPYGKESKEALKKLIDRKYVRVSVVGTKGKRGRLMGKVFVKYKHINEEMVRKGHAWAIRPKYLEDQGMLAHQAEAREGKKGLWATGTPIAPWKWGKEENGDEDVK